LEERTTGFERTKKNKEKIELKTQGK
jgi:hypothetical protein